MKTIKRTLYSGHGIKSNIPISPHAGVSKQQNSLKFNQSCTLYSPILASRIQDSMPWYQADPSFSEEVLKDTL